MSNWRHHIVLFFKGLAMGAADVVPGVSGGTIAFISGIYSELINTIKSINMQALKILRHQGVLAAWEHINGTFIMVLLGGILTSLFSLARIMHYLLDTYPLPLWAFFTGLIVGSVAYLLRQHPLSGSLEKFFFVLGVVIAYGISMAPLMVLEGNLITMFFAGSIALCAMILPGISGSFILVLLGLYPVFIGAIANLQLDILVVFASGGIIGLMIFSRLLSWLLAHFQDRVIAVMCGFLVGSLNVIWPWKEVVTSGQALGQTASNLLPNQFFAVAGQDPQTLICITTFFLGLALVLLLEYAANIKSNPVS
jgi:putative membrane protein